MNAPPAHAVALLRGLADDYARLLREGGNATTSGLVSGIAKEASDSLILHLRAQKQMPGQDTEAHPQDIPVTEP